MTSPRGSSSDGDPDAGGTPPSLAGQLGRHAGHGVTLAASTLLFAWLGHELDERLGTGSLFVVLGSLVGFGAGFYHMYRQLTGGDRVPGADDAGEEEGP